MIDFFGEDDPDLIFSVEPKKEVKRGIIDRW